MFTTGLAVATITAFTTLSLFSSARNLALVALFWSIRMFALAFGWSVVAIIILPIWFVNWVWPFKPEYLREDGAPSPTANKNMGAILGRGLDDMREESSNVSWVDRRLLRAQAATQFPDYAPVFDGTD